MSGPQRNPAHRLKRIWSAGAVVLVAISMLAYYLRQAPAPLLAGASPQEPPASSWLATLGLHDASDLAGVALLAVFLVLVALSVRTVLQQGPAARGAVTVEVPLDASGDLRYERASKPREPRGDSQRRRSSEPARSKTATQARGPAESLPSRGVEALLTCTRSDVLNPGAYLDDAVSALRGEGAAGARALAALLREMLAARTAGITWALAAAAKVESVDELEEVVDAVVGASATIAASGGDRFTPEIFGGGRIGWTDSTHARVRELAAEALQAQRAESAAAPASGAQATSGLHCEHCGKAVESTIPVELRSPDGSRSRSLSVCDACLEDLASGAIQIRFE